MKKILAHLHASLLFAILCLLASQNAIAQAGGQKPELIMSKHNSGPGGPNVLEGDTLGTIRWDGWTAVKKIRTGASIRSVITGPVSPGVLPANLSFRTGTPLQIDRMVITHDGLVGIGLWQPNFNLDVVGNTHTSGNFYGRLHIDNTAGTNAAPNTYDDEATIERKADTDLGVTDPGTHGALMSLAPGALAFDHQLYFGNEGIYNRYKDGEAADWSGATWYKLLSGFDIHGTPNYVPKFTGPNSLGDSQIFDNSTNVGIGTAAPGYKLDVNGDLRAATGMSAGTSIAAGTNISAAQDISAGGDVTVGDALTVDGFTGLGTAVPNFRLHTVGDSYFNGRMAIGPNANFSTGYNLSVQGKIITEEVQVLLYGSWPDYVFGENHPRPDIKHWESYINEHKHLPGLPSAAEVEAEGGFPVGETQRLLLEKIEELTLMIIDQQKQIDALQQQVANSKH